jgi:hypothetical protein
MHIVDILFEHMAKPDAPHKSCECEKSKSESTTSVMINRRHKQEKKRAYDQRIREVEHGCFSPLVFSVSGGMGPAANVVYKKLASMIAAKHSQSYSQTINWLRCRLSFSLLRSSIMCIRGSHSSANHPANPLLSEAAIDHALCDSRVAPE